MPEEHKHDIDHHKDFIRAEKLFEADPCVNYKSAGACDADQQCTWCTNFAVPSECWLISDAKSLPPGVYNCDKLNETEPLPIESLVKITEEAPELPSDEI